MHGLGLTCMPVAELAASRGSLYTQPQGLSAAGRAAAHGVASDRVLWAYVQHRCLGLVLPGLLLTPQARLPTAQAQHPAAGAGTAAGASQGSFTSLFVPLS